MTGFVALRGAYARGVAVSVGVFVFFGTVTGLVPNPLYVRMVPRTGVDYLFLVLTSVLAGVYVTRRASSACNTDGGNADRWAFGGLAGGYLAVACPVCNVVLVSAFGSSALMTYFDPYRPVVGAVSVAVLGIAVYVQRTRGSCA
ncbi:MAG: hypothetical protein ACLFSW_01495 [Halobacteriales archaeon]